MTMVLFDIHSGEKLTEFNSEDSARRGMREANNGAGWVRLCASWTNGIECEMAANIHGERDYAPYGITEVERWEARFQPEFVKQRNEH